MPGKTKKGKSKSRLDKWYHIAKEQGYRSRAAFKLIQLNRKYNFLNNANVLVDLCAAPGGWLQVATRYMPVSSIKIGIDLDSIRHVPGCITLQEDITTPRCLALIKKEIRSEKVDVVLNDGAPNVGANWRKDAFAQVELVLAALKLAATVLRRGGTFVTKVFRSADYNSLIWVLNKFFEKVEATKPAASRTSSAEIFIVCLRYLAPEYTDPKLFDARFVFKDTEQDLLDATNKEHLSLDKMLKLRSKRNREGYEDEAGPLLYKTVTFGEFIKSDDPTKTIRDHNKMIITPADQENYVSLVGLPEDYKEILEDLKQQGKRELKILLNWRTKIQRALAKQKKKETNADGLVVEDEADKADDMDAKLETDLEKEQRKKLKLLRKEREHKLNRTIKLKADAPGVIENDAETEFDWGQKRNFEKLGFVDLDEEDDVPEVPIEKKQKKDVREVEENIELLYDLKKKSIANEERRRLARIEEQRRKKFGDEIDEDEHQLETIEGKNTEMIDEEKPKPKSRLQAIDVEDDDDDDDEDYEDLEDDVDTIKTVTQNALERSKWFDRDIFKQGIDAENPEGLATITNPMKLSNLRRQRKGQDEVAPVNGEAMDNEDDGFEDVDEDEGKQAAKKKDKLKIKASMQGSEKRRQKIRQDSIYNDINNMNAEDNNQIEVVPALRYEDYDIDSLTQIRALAKKMLRKKDREEIIEDSYNRYWRPVDEDAPDWFKDEEERHNHKILPITKEEYAIEKQKLLDWKNRPIKKIAEAKIRKKFQVQKKLRKASDRAKDIMEQEGVTESSKLKQVQNLYKKAIASKKVEKKYIVSKKFGDKSKGNRKTGRNTRMVDSRLKKDKRAQKRVEKRKGGPRTVKKSKKRQISRR